MDSEADTLRPVDAFGRVLSVTGTQAQVRFPVGADDIRATLEKAKADGVSAPVMEFAPDAAFACDLRNDSAAEALLKKHNLEPGQFVCCIPRLRYTPYWKIRNTPMTDQQGARAQRNEAMADPDHAPLREAIVAVVRETGLKVLITCEDWNGSTYLSNAVVIAQPVS